YNVVVFLATQLIRSRWYEQFEFADHDSSTLRVGNKGPGRDAGTEPHHQDGTWSAGEWCVTQRRNMRHHTLEAHVDGRRGGFRLSTHIEKPLVSPLRDDDRGINSLADKQRSCQFVAGDTESAQNGRDAPAVSHNLPRHIGKSGCQSPGQQKRGDGSPARHPHGRTVAHVEARTR